MITKYLYFYYFFSGFISLIFQILWQRQISLIIGGTILSASILLSSWMLGLSIGSFLVSKFSHKIKNPFKIFLVLQIVFLFYSLLLIIIFKIIGFVDIFILNYLNNNFSFFFRSLIIFSSIIVPTSIIGSSLPILSMLVTKDKIAFLYSLNALGSVLGSVITGFLLIRFFGTILTYYLTSFFGLVIFVLGFVIREKTFKQKNDDNQYMITGNNLSLNLKKCDFFRKILLLIFLLSGFSSLSYEIIYNRVLIYFTGNNIYCFTVITSIFILGISCGSLFFGIIQNKLSIQNKIFLLIITQLLIGFWHIIFPDFSLIINDFAIIIKQSFTSSKIFSLFLSRIISSILLIFVPVFSFGIFFPLIVDIYKSISAGNLEKNVSLLYSFNTLGSVIGPMLTTFLLINFFQLSKSLRIISYINIFISFLAFITFLDIIMIKSKKIFLFVTILLASVLSFIFNSDLKISKLASKTKKSDEILYFKEGVYGSVSVTRRNNGVKHLKINGVGEVPTDYNSIRVFKLLAYLPFAIKENIESVLTIAFGGGITYGSISTIDYVKSREVVEICKDVIDAATYFNEWNHNILEKRKEIIVDDGRHYIDKIIKKYDLIVSDATHPISSDSWVLYTREFYQNCKSKLNTDGIFAQWLPIHQISLLDYKTILKTISSVFVETALFYCNEYTIVVGWNKNILPNNSAFTKILKNDISRIDLKKVNFDNINDIKLTKLFDTENIKEFSKNGKIATDDNSMIQFGEIRSLGIETRNDILDSFINFLESKHKNSEIIYKIVSLNMHNLFFQKKYIDAYFYINNKISELKSNNVYNSEIEHQLKILKESVSYYFCLPETINKYLGNPSDENIKEIEKLSDYLPNDKNILLLKGILYYKKNKYYDALSCFINVHNLQKSPDTYRNIIIILKKMKKFDEASMYLTEARSLYGSKWEKDLDK